MVLTLILLSIGALLFLVITYNIVQQYKQKQETDRRILMSKQKLIIDESDELLLNASRLPYTKNLVLLLRVRQHRPGVRVQWSCQWGRGPAPPV